MSATTQPPGGDIRPRIYKGVCPLCQKECKYYRSDLEQEPYYNAIEMRHEAHTDCCKPSCEGVVTAVAQK